MQPNEEDNNNNNNNKANTNLALFPPKPNVSRSRAEGINLLRNKCGARRQAVIKVLTDQSASDSEPAIILTESNEHSKPRSAPNMKGDVICWQLGSRRGSRRGEGRRERSRESERERSVTGQEGPQRKRGRDRLHSAQPAASLPGPQHSTDAARRGPEAQVWWTVGPPHPKRRRWEGCRQRPGWGPGLRSLSSSHGRVSQELSTFS